MSKNTLDIYKIGTKVKLTEDIFGTITAVCIRGNNYITYECSWWNGRDHDNKWFYEDELEVSLSDKTRIGFV